MTSTTSQRQFAEAVVGRFDQYRACDSWVSKSVAAGAGLAGAGVGHPSFEAVPLGANDHCDLAVGYLDLSKFTWRSFWDNATDTVFLARAVLDQFSLVVQDRGGYILGFRGDGLMVGWGDRGSNATADVDCAVAACAFALDACRGALNEMLELYGIEPVIAKAGLDHGRCDFVRMGTVDANDINIVGFPANFAAKCEKYAHAWEIVVGEQAVRHLNPSRLTMHPESPQSYTRNYQTKSYAFATFDWDDQAFLSEAAALPLDLAGRPSRSVDVRF